MSIARLDIRKRGGVGTYLLSAGRAATADEAVAVLRKARPSIILRAEVLQALGRFQPNSSSHVRLALSSSW